MRDLTETLSSFQIVSNQPVKVGRNIWEKEGRNSRRVETSGNRTETRSSYGEELSGMNLHYILMIREF